MTDINTNQTHDLVYLHGIKCDATIGVWAWEKAIQQTITLDIDLACHTKPPAENDDLSLALDYQAIAKRVQEFTKSSQFELIETLAERIATLILNEFSTPWVRVRLDKGQAVPGVKNVGVVIERKAS